VFSLIHLAVNTTWPIFAAERRAAAQCTPMSTDISCPHGAQQQTQMTGQKDGQMDRQTPNRYIDRYTMWAVAVRQLLQQKQQTKKTKRLNLTNFLTAVFSVGVRGNPMREY